MQRRTTTHWLCAGLMTAAAGSAAAQSAYPNHAIRMVVPSSVGGLGASSEQGSRLRDENVRESTAAAVLIAQAPIPREQYPTHTIRLVVPSSAGGGSDIVARIVAPKLAERIGQQVVVDNRPGAGTMIGGEIVARSAPDGYTLLMAISTLATNPVVYKKMPYDALRDFAPVTEIAALPDILVVHPSVPVRTAQKLIAFARAHPGQLSYGSPGTGTNPHLAMELFCSMAKVSMVHIPYKGSAPAIIDIVAGHISVMAATALTGIPHVRSGRLRALAVTSATRTAAAPEVPTLAEAALPGYEAVQWYGVLAPAQTPPDIVAKLHAEIARILQLPEVKDRLLGDGADPVANTPDEFARFIRDETAKWAQVARDAGIKPE
jgi:tripartite-type tricarboxylate transporter receptor subunit TctC